jgi:hypothetical protein
MRTLRLAVVILMAYAAVAAIAIGAWQLAALCVGGGR